MSLHEYNVSSQIMKEDHPFYALIMTAMRQADTENAAKLRAAFPDIWTELESRYHAPRGLLAGEQDDAFRCDEFGELYDLRASPDDHREGAST